MNKTWLITKREYVTRVQTKTFLLTTFLGPVAVLLFYALLIFLVMRGSDEKKTIAILDNANLTEDVNLERKNLEFVVETRSFDEVVTEYENKRYAGILELPPVTTDQKEYSIIYHSDDQLALDETGTIESIFRRKVRDLKITALGIDRTNLDLIDTDISVQPKTINQKEKEISSLTAVVSSALGGIVGTVLFMVILIYGSQVMRGVNEEKLNRIVEVLISSVKPFELMMGKVLGVGLVGLTQFAIWGILIFSLSSVAMPLLGLSPEMAGELTSPEAQEILKEQGDKAQIGQIFKELGAINWGLILPLYLFYFVTGYLTYSSLFAAIGAAVGDDINEAQSLTMIAMLPLIISVYIGYAAVAAPHSSIATWASIIPISSAVVMPFRLAANPAFWQIGLSVLFSIVFVLLMVWLAAKIYRVGILMYGKKASFKELGKWLFYKG